MGVLLCINTVKQGSTLTVISSDLIDNSAQVGDSLYCADSTILFNQTEVLPHSARDGGAWLGVLHLTKTCFRAKRSDLR